MISRFWKFGFLLLLEVADKKIFKNLPFPISENFG
jgi:hypothetical protein